MTTALATKTLDCISAGLKSGKSTCVPELVQLVQTLSANAVDISVQELADLIQKDATVMARVIGAANTLGYNPSSNPIDTVAQAIHLVGFNRILSLAMSLMLVEHASRTQTPDEQRETATLALCSGLVAQAIASENGSDNAEQVFICASLRNFGQLLMTTFMVEQYREARQLATRTGATDEAFVEIFGLTPLELGHTLLKSSNLPPVILNSLRVCHPEKIVGALQPDTQMLLVAEYSVRLCELTLDAKLSAAVFKARALALNARFRPHLRVSMDQLGEHLSLARDKFDQFRRAFGEQGLSQHVTKRLRERIAGDNPPLSVPPAPADPPPDPKPAPDAAGVGASANPLLSEVHAPPSTALADAMLIATHVFHEGITQLTECLGQNPINLKQAYQIALDHVCQGFGAPEGVLFVTGRANDFQPLLGRGHMLARLDRRAHVLLEDRNACGICLTRRETILIHNTRDPKITPYLPPWLLACEHVGACMLLPVCERDKPFALILAGWPTPRQIVVPSDHARLVRSLLGLVGTARRLASLT